MIPVETIGRGAMGVERVPLSIRRLLVMKMKGAWSARWKKK